MNVIRLNSQLGTETSIVRFDAVAQAVIMEPISASTVDPALFALFLRAHVRMQRTIVGLLRG